MVRVSLRELDRDRITEPLRDMDAVRDIERDTVTERVPVVDLPTVLV